MKRTVQALFLTILAAEVLVAGQGADVKRVLSEVRTALGGEEKLAAVKSVAIEGQVARTAPDGGSSSSDFEMAFELPDRYIKIDVFANINGMALKRRAGFNGAEAIDDRDMPQMGGGGGMMHVMTMSPGGGMVGGQASPEQVAAQKAALLASSKKEFARLVLGLLGTSTTAFPVEFKYAGQAQSQDGMADVVEVQGADGFTAKFFTDSKTHLPLMVSWMDKEPLRVTMGGPGGGNVQVMRGAGGGAEEAKRMQQEMADRVKQAEASRRTIEYRTFYAGYKAVNGLNLPTRIQRMQDGVPVEEMTLEKIKINQKIDAAKFKVSK